MPQASAWEREYRSPQLVTKEPGLRTDVKRFLMFVRKHTGHPVEGLRVLDLGCGTGRNANELAARGNMVTGMDIAPTAIRLANERARALGVPAAYRVGDMGSPYPFPDASFDVVLDVMSSNSLDEKERAIYLRETARVLTPGGLLFVRGLCKDGDKHAKTLLRSHPGPEPDTYRLDALGLVERVFSHADFIQTYSPFFNILSLTKKANYARFGGQSYKRQYWLAYLERMAHDTE